MLIKEYGKITLDQERRFRFSKNERAQFGEKVFITKKQNRLFFYTEEEWNQSMSKELTGLRGADFRRRNRFLSRSASLERIDSQGSVFIEEYLFPPF